MIGATMIESADRGAVTVRSALEMLGAAYALHPAFGEAEILEMSADVRPAYPDNEPRIEERGGRIFVNGFYRHGFLLAPAFAERAATLAFARAGERRMRLVVNGETRDVEATTLAERARSARLRRGDGRDRAQRRVRARARARRDAGQGRRPDRDPRAAAGGVRRCGALKIPSLRGASATKQSSGRRAPDVPMDCFASLAMTASDIRTCP